MLESPPIEEALVNWGHRNNFSVMHRDWKDAGRNFYFDAGNNGRANLKLTYERRIFVPTGIVHYNLAERVQHLNSEEGLPKFLEDGIPYYNVVGWYMGYYHPEWKSDKLYLSEEMVAKSFIHAHIVINSELNLVLNSSIEINPALRQTCLSLRNTSDIPLVDSPRSIKGRFDAVSESMLQSIANCIKLGKKIPVMQRK